jgi:hypothetical protein
MAFTEEGGLKKYKKYEEHDIGDVVCEGWFIRAVAGNYINPNYEVREAATGEIFVANGCGLLKRKMEDAGIKPGDYIRIEYHGTDVMRKGKFKGKPAHNLKLFRDASLFDPTLGASAAPGVAGEEKPKPKPTRKPSFTEEEEATPAERRKKFADSLPADEDDEEDFIV